VPLLVFAGIFGFLSLCAGSNAQVVVKQLSAYPLPSKARDALNEVAGQSDVLILGEIHGTQEVPAVATALLEPFTKLGYRLLALEIPADQQGPLTDWATGKTATVPRFFTKEIEDGRGNRQVLSLIRTALAPPFRWQLICFDEPGSDADYEVPFAEAAEQQAKSDTQPDDLLKLSVAAMRTWRRHWRSNVKSFLPMAKYWRFAGMFTLALPITPRQTISCASSGPHSPLDCKPLTPPGKFDLSTSYP